MWFQNIGGSDMGEVKELYFNKVEGQEDREYSETDDIPFDEEDLNENATVEEAEEVVSDEYWDYITSKYEIGEF